tara:strand:- start:982 stop:1284 length:303 start_codon:yes stop_codon:yes gene_type:complete
MNSTKRLISGMPAEQVATTAFAWAAFGAAEAFLHAVSRNSNGGESCARYMLDYITAGGLDLPPRHFIDQTIDMSPWLLPYRRRAMQTIDRLARERDEAGQ